MPLIVECMECRQALEYSSRMTTSGDTEFSIRPCECLRCAPDVSYDRGYEDGRESGYSAGKEDGYEDGWGAGWEDGYTEGRAEYE